MKAVKPEEVRALLGNAVAQQLEWYETRWRTAAHHWGLVRKRHHELLATLKSALTLDLTQDEWKQLIEEAVKE